MSHAAQLMTRMRSLEPGGLPFRTRMLTTLGAVVLLICGSAIARETRGPRP